MYNLSAVPAFAQAAFEAPAEPAAAQLTNAFSVSFNDAEEAVAAALNEKGIGDKLSVTIAGRRNTSIFAYSKPVSLEIKGLTIERLDHRWDASLLFVAGNEVVSAIPISGHFDEIIELPVLKREVRAGDVISAADIEVRDFSQAHTRTDTITDISDLIGKSSSHDLSPSRPIREHEVANPTLIKRNALIEMHYNSPGMEISTTGEAMGDGAKGDVINVRNSSSKKIVRAVVADSKSVNIIAPDTQTSQLTGSGYGTN